VSPVPAQMWQRRAQSRRRCGSGERSPGEDVAAMSPVPVQLIKVQGSASRGRDSPFFMYFSVQVATACVYAAA